MNGNGNGKIKIDSLDEKIKEKIKITGVYIGFIRDFCPYSGYSEYMTDEEALAIEECVVVGKRACKTHKYDPENEL